jgi:HK97 family phage portal protein
MSTFKQYIAQKALDVSLALMGARKPAAGQSLQLWQDAGILGGRSYTGGISPDADQGELLKAYQGWVFAAATLIARNVAKVPLRLYATINGDDQEIWEHPLLELLERVNPLKTPYELWQETIIQLELCGNAYWYLAPNRLGIPGELWPIPPDRMSVVPDAQVLIKGYLYSYQGATLAFDRSEIIHLKYPNPNSIYYGMGTLQAATYEYDADLYMKQYSNNLFKNDGRPTGAITTDQTLDEGTVRKIQAAWKSVYGGVDKAGKIAVLQGGTKYQQLQMAPNEMDFVNSRKYNRDEILGIFGVPASKLGLVEDVNRANADANDATFQSEVIEPRLKMLEDIFAKHLTPRYDARLWLQFDNPVPEDREFALKQQDLHLKNYVISIDEARESEGYEASTWGKVPLVPFNLVPIDQLSGEFGQQPYEAVQDEEEPAPDAEPAADETEKQSLPGKRKFVQAKTQEHRDLLWKQFLRVHVPLQEKFRNKLRGLFKEQRKAVLANLQKAPIKSSGPIRQNADPALVDSILFNANEWIDKFAQTMSPEFMNIFTAGVDKALDDMAAGNYSFDFRNPKVTSYLKNKTYKFAQEVNNATMESLRKELITGLNAFENLDQIAERINKVFDYSDTWRGLRIARTETTCAINSGMVQAYDQSGLAQGKGWLTSRDEKVRLSHEIDGQEVAVNDMFKLKSGQSVRFPGDPDAQIADIINCRCTMYPVAKMES